MGSSKEKLQDRVDDLLNNRAGFWSHVYSFVLSILVAAICVTFVAQTYQISTELNLFLLRFDEIVTYIFLAEYIVRFWARRFEWRYLFRPMSIIDLLAILPLFVPAAHWQFVRILRVIRIFRLLRVMRQNRILGWTVTEVHLRLTWIAFSIFCIVFISAGLIYDAEHGSNPLVFDTFFDAVYFTIISLSTVGYGDMVPSSEAGRLVTLGMILSGALVLPWQVSKLVKTFIIGVRRMKRSCSKCHLLIHDSDANHCKLCGAKLAQEPTGD